MVFRAGHSYHPPKSEEARQKKLDAHIGKLRSAETKAKIGAAHKGKIVSIETREKQSASRQGKPVSERALAALARGRTMRTQETIRKIGDALRARVPNPVTPERKRIRNSAAFREWRQAVFDRDRWTCQKCGKHGGDMHPHHVLNFSEHPELRFDVENGITFCVMHHKAFHAIYGGKNNNRIQIEEFI